MTLKISIGYVCEDVCIQREKKLYTLQMTVGGMYYKKEDCNSILPYSYPVCRHYCLRLPSLAYTISSVFCIEEQFPNSNL